MSWCWDYNTYGYSNQLWVYCHYIFTSVRGTLIHLGMGIKVTELACLILKISISARLRWYVHLIISICRFTFLRDSNYNYIYFTHTLGDFGDLGEVDRWIGSEGRLGEFDSWLGDVGSLNEDWRSFRILDLQITHRSGRHRCATATWIVLMKHFRHTTLWPHGYVCIVAFAARHTTHYKKK